MSFWEVKAHTPYMLCLCGHRADIHLYSGDHICVQTGCGCEGFSPKEEGVQETVDLWAQLMRQEP